MMQEKKQMHKPSRLRFFLYKIRGCTRLFLRPLYEFIILAYKLDLDIISMQFEEINSKMEF